jgi:hypothetical protein
MIVKGPLIQAQFVETFILMQFNHQSLIATKANRIVRSALGRPVMEFGTRRAHGADAAVYGARASYIAGCAGTACTIADRNHDTPALGTMAHSWVQSFDSEYEAFKKYLYPNETHLNYQRKMNMLRSLAGRHDAGDAVLWYSYDGFFWFPRVLMGIENHLYSFYDEPELYHKICEDLADYIIGELPKIYAVCKPDFMVISEDMSYNNGPMISEELFNEFLLPYYQKIIPEIKKYGTKVIIDTDGDVSMMIPWLIRAGIDGVLPLERQAGVDLVKLKEQYPDFIFIGGYDKMTMSAGEEAMKKEFERLAPVMRAGGYIPSCDHQTPPGVSFENYQIYVRLLKEYAEKTVK